MMTGSFHMTMCCRDADWAPGHVRWNDGPMDVDAGRASDAERLIFGVVAAGQGHCALIATGEDSPAIRSK
jgi:hypothetical protein